MKRLNGVGGDGYGVWGGVFLACYYFPVVYFCLVLFVVVVF